MFFMVLCIWQILSKHLLDEPGVNKEQFIDLNTVSQEMQEFNLSPFVKAQWTENKHSKMYTYKSKLNVIYIKNKQVNN